jgi:hypothetical protein
MDILLCPPFLGYLINIAFTLLDDNFRAED